MELQEIIDRLPFPLNIALFGADIVLEGSVFLLVVASATAVVQVVSLTDRVRQALDALARLVQLLFEMPGTGETEVIA